jgi:UDP-N-acetylmuramoyl-tripeptide--D-alanyl-D-alanine ligase
MEGMSLTEVADVLSAKLAMVGDPQTIFPTGGSIDTRSLHQGELFFALSGEHTDGHRFVTRAMEAGASASVVTEVWYKQQSPRPTGPLLLVKSPDQALGELGKQYRKRFRIPVIGITGSTGKTTTKDMTALVLSTRHDVMSTKGNMNNRLGLPLTLLGLSKQHDVAVIEMGISEHGGMKYLSEIADPTIGVITNVGPTHLEFLGSVEGVAKAKGELLEYLDESSMAILNLDDLILSKEQARLKGRLLGFGIEKICQFRGEGLVFDREGCGQFSLQSRKFQLSVPGRHNVYNALAAVAAGSELDVPIEEAAQTLASFRPPSLRSQLLERDGIRLLNDSYNANPASMQAALISISEMNVELGGRRVAVLGDMLELGETGPELHRELGGFAAKHGMDELFVLGTFSREVADGWVDAGQSSKHVCIFEDKQNLVEDLQEFLMSGDLVLIKGSRGLAMEDVVKALDF